MGPDEEFFYQVLEEVDIPDLEGWPFHLREGSADPLIAPLLALTPDLQSVVFSVPGSSRWPRQVLGRGVLSPVALDISRFTRLQKIEYWGEMCPESNEILRFFLLPSMQTVLVKFRWDPHVPKGLDASRQRMYYPLPNGTSSITTSELKIINIKPRTIEGIVRSSRALETCSASYAVGPALYRDLPVDYEFPDALGPPKLAKTLSWAKHILRYLKFHVQSFEHCNFSRRLLDKPDIQPFGSL